MEMFKIIGISGVGRAGKDSFYRFASEFLEAQGVSYCRWAFADELKRDLDQFIFEKFGFSAFTEITEQKNKIRPLFVEYGKIRRNESKGQYWLNKIQPTILDKESVFQVRFITDLRFAEYGNVDELAFVQNNGGKIVHIEKYENKDWFGQFHVLEPANAEEERNDPMIRKAADVRFRWHNYNHYEQGENLARSEVWRLMSANPGLWDLSSEKIERQQEKWEDAQLLNEFLP